MVTAVGSAWAVRRGKRWAKWLWAAAWVSGLAFQAVSLAKDGVGGLVPLLVVFTLAGLSLQALALFYAFRNMFVRL